MMLCRTITYCGMFVLLCFSGVGRVQPFFPQLLYDAVGKAEQQMSAMSARLGRAEDRKIRETDFVCVCMSELAIIEFMLPENNRLNCLHSVYWLLTNYMY